MFVEYTTSWTSRNQSGFAHINRKYRMFIATPYTNDDAIFCCNDVLHSTLCCLFASAMYCVYKHVCTIFTLFSVLAACCHLVLCSTKQWTGANGKHTIHLNFSCFRAKNEQFLEFDRILYFFSSKKSLSTKANIEIKFPKDYREEKRSGKFIFVFILNI